MKSYLLKLINYKLKKFKGRCRTRNLSNIRREADIRTSRPGVVANDQPSSTVIFVGTGPSLFSVSSSFVEVQSTVSDSAPKVLYVGSTYVPASNGPRDALDVPAVSSLILDSENHLFEFTSQTISAGTYMKLDYRRMPTFKYKLLNFLINLNFKILKSLQILFFNFNFLELIMLAALRRTDLLISLLASQNMFRLRSHSLKSPSWYVYVLKIQIFIVIQKHH